MLRMASTRLTFAHSLGHFISPLTRSFSVQLTERKSAMPHPQIPFRFTQTKIQQRHFTSQEFTPLPNLSTKDKVAKLTSLQKKSLKILRTGAMSYGSISEEAHIAISEAINQLAMAIANVESFDDLVKLGDSAGPISNSGEGGESRKRDGTIYQSRTRQMASGRYGVTIRYLAKGVVIIEIKINQGAKPGQGGELDGKKVVKDIAETRNVEEFTTLISPPTAHDTDSIEDLKELIDNLRAANPNAKISVKLAAGENIGVIAAGVVKCGADIIHIAGPGGTGKAQLTSKFDFVHSWETALADVHQTLTAEGLRSSVELVVSGGLQTGLDIFKALLLGANKAEMGTMILTSLGCIMAEVCHDGSCPTGIATTNPELIQKTFKGKPEHVVQLVIEIAKSLSTYLERYGFTDPSQAVGRTDLLQVKDNPPLTSLETLLRKPKNPYYSFGKLPKREISSYEEKTVIQKIQAGKSDIEITTPDTISAFGAHMAYHSIMTPDFAEAFHKQPVTVRFNPFASLQSFGFLGQKGLTLIAHHSNDGTGKSLEGATIVIKGVAGNYTGYGATSGRVFASYSGDRTAVRNSGAHITLIQTGHMGANFMTGGSLTIIASPSYYPGLTPSATFVPPVLFRDDMVGPNFGAGFSGGKVFMPRYLYKDLLENGYLAPSCQRIIPQKLDESDAAALGGRLKEFNQHIPNSWVGSLAANPSAHHYFIKLDPKLTYPEGKMPKVERSSAKRKPASAPQGQSPIQRSSAAVALPPIVKPPEITLPLSAIPESTSTSPTERIVAEKDACGTGVLVHLDGTSTREMTTKALTMLARFKHRGSIGIDPKTGDGCGILFYGLDAFFQKMFPDLPIKKGNYSIIPMLMAGTEAEQANALALFKELLTKEGLKIDGGRDVPTDRSLLGLIGQQQESSLRQWVVLKPETLSQEEFEKCLVRTRLRFELTLQDKCAAVRPHIFSASSYNVIYKTMALEDQFAHYFADFADPDFQTSAAMSHARFATNVLPVPKNIQPLPKFGNNGENNALQRLVLLLSKHPFFKQLLGVDRINLRGCSDSSIMSTYMDLLHLAGFSIEEIVASTIHPYDPNGNDTSLFYNLFATPFEGPNASIIAMGHKIIIVRDTNGLRPQRGILNKEFVYSGSELGPVEMAGEILDPPPGKPLLIDLNTGTVSLHEPEPEIKAMHERQLDQLKPLQPNIFEREPIQFSQEELTLRKYRAGWDDEVEKMIIQPLFQGKKTASSMGDQGPIEALVDGSFFNLGHFIKGNFSEVTNPALPVEQEKCYMRLNTFVGAKPSLLELGKVTVDGFKLDSPIVDNHEMAYLQAQDSLKPQTINITYPVRSREQGLSIAIKHLREECVRMAREGAILITLSDLASDDHHASIPPVLAASVVHDALLSAGLREKVTIALQAGSMLGGRDIAQAISIGSVDIINPYLPFTPNKDKQSSAVELKRYKKSLEDELLGFMGRMGIPSVSAYRGTKGFNGYGLDKEVADLLGISSKLGGLSLQDMSRIILTNHVFPLKGGIGKYDWQGQPAREKIWGNGIAAQAVAVARGSGDFKTLEARMNLLKKGFPRDWLRLVKPRVWNEQNPITICILGGGAAGFYQARALLDSGLPVKIIIIEKKHGNKFGLVGDGIAPDHLATKNQANLLRDCLRDKRVQYHGGMEVGKQVSYEHLKTTYPCLIDCRGAAEDIRLNVPGEEKETTGGGVIPASTIFRLYNNEFDPLKKIPWPFKKSKNPVVGIIGSGNVAADIARMLVSNPEKLESTNINPKFLDFLSEQGPAIVRLFARGNPWETKISLKELKELEALGIGLSATFDDSLVDKQKLTAEQQPLYDFFKKIHGKAYPKEGGKVLCFHFQMVPQEFKRIEGEIEATFTDHHHKKHSIRARNFITAIGTRPITDNERSVYASGWVIGKGGTLQKAEQSAQETTEQIIRDFRQGLFNNRMEPPGPQQWQLDSPIGNLEFESILDWLEDKKDFVTEQDFRNARHYRRSGTATETPAPQLTQEAPVMTPVAEPDKITLVTKDGRSRSMPLPSTPVNLLQFFKQEKVAPKHQCDGQLTCCECRATVISSSNEIKRSAKEKALLKANHAKPGEITSCAHDTDELRGSVLRLT